MIAPNENGRPTEAGTPVAGQRASADAALEKPNTFPLPMGATPREVNPEPIGPVVERTIARMRRMWEAEDRQLAVYARVREAEGLELAPDPIICPRCSVLVEDEARCWSCGRHGGDA